LHVIVRDLKEEDLSLIKKFTVQTGWRDVPKGQKKELDRDEFGKRLLEIFDALSKREHHKIFVAEDENHRFLGYLFVGKGSNMLTGKDHGYIYDIFVKKEFRGKGIGKTLLNKAQSYCKQVGFSRILLMVSVENDVAAGLYKKMGFKTESMYMGKDLRAHARPGRGYS
jgi:ribosomal protein S18 acetylase RimI-like enzyme